jgi:hypothetical protein
VQVDDGAFRPQRNIKFDAWADRWLDGLERKATTVASYQGTLQYAKAVFGEKVVRRLGPQDISRFNGSLKGVVVAKGTPDRRERKLSDSSRSKHLRVVGICLQSAVIHGYAAQNPLRLLPPSKPRPGRKGIGVL